MPACANPSGDAVIEPIWLVEATYAPDAAETRVPFRAAHLAGILELLAPGVVVEAGAFIDVSASMVLVRRREPRRRPRPRPRRRLPAQRRLGRGAGAAVRTGDATRPADRACPGESCHRVRAPDSVLAASDAAPSAVRASESARRDRASRPVARRRAGSFAAGWRRSSARCRPTGVAGARRGRSLRRRAGRRRRFGGWRRGGARRRRGRRRARSGAAFWAWTSRRRQVEDDRHGRDVPARGPARERPAVLGLRVRRVDDGQLAARRGGARASDGGCGRRPPTRAGPPRSPRRRARSASEETISSGAKSRAASVDLPEPAAPTRTTRLGSGRTRVDTGRCGPAHATGAPADLVAAALRGADLVARLVVDRRPARASPSLSRNREPCQGHSTQPSTIVPSASGPPAWAHTSWRAWTVSPIRTTTRSLIPARILVGVASGRRRGR